MAVIIVRKRLTSPIYVYLACFRGFSTTDDDEEAARERRRNAREESSSSTVTTEVNNTHR
jgi:hypothetical protein